MRILQIGKFYLPHMGGLETHLHDLCAELRNSMDVRVIVANDSSHTRSEVYKGIPITRIGTKLTLASTPICPAMVREIRDADVDIIHIHLPNPAAVLAYLANDHPARLVVTYHSDTVRQRFLGALFEPILHAVLRKSSAIVATSVNYLETSRTLSLHRQRCVVVPYGIRVDGFRNANPRIVEQLKQQYGGRILLSVGRLVYYKGFEFLVRAMTNVDGCLLIVGDGPLRKGLERLAVSLGVSGKTKFLGEIQNEMLAPYYHAATAFVLPSVARSEAFGIVQLEAMASGTPVVNTALDSGVPFVSQHGQTGLTVPPADSNALANAINCLLDDCEQQSRFGEAARRRAEDEFGLDLMVSRMIDVYRQVLGQHMDRTEHVLAARA